ncbi:nucleoside triphosphate hydrolase [Shimia sp.]|uniref:nucleoside triphosphate hydrolase n=1 Tax=Shimia sp. TaxID=1954381 RepID=UPI003BAC5E38
MKSLSKDARNLSLSALIQHIQGQTCDTRFMVAIVGPPGSGKSTVAKQLQNMLNATAPKSTVIVPMDGFHFDNAVLRERGRTAHKGAPDTFDVAALHMVLQRLRTAFGGEDIALPVFDRTLDLSRASARLVTKHTKILLVEGNYLLVDQPPWDTLRSFFAMTVMIDVDLETIRERLLKRWTDLNFTQAQAIAKADDNDLPNARFVLQNSASPDFILSQD